MCMCVRNPGGLPAIQMRWTRILRRPNIKSEDRASADHWSGIIKNVGRTIGPNQSSALTFDIGSHALNYASECRKRPAIRYYSGTMVKNFDEFGFKNSNSDQT